ncbi:unnamed protein product [Prorocentrum cordatum]|uniref:GB1/RHD3-type G domain-containing protein n=1 Tax=Prorocentrum cordatum TaxID=2364126 RepID=A0ABN9RP00_9DINO|nr:unnamed protein product [Polarella glacialis]
MTSPVPGQNPEANTHMPCKTPRTGPMTVSIATPLSETNAHMPCKTPRTGPMTVSIATPLSETNAHMPCKTPRTGPMIVSIATPMHAGPTVMEANAHIPCKTPRAGPMTVSIATPMYTGPTVIAIDTPPSSPRSLGPEPQATEEGRRGSAASAVSAAPPAHGGDESPACSPPQSGRRPGGATAEPSTEPPAAGASTPSGPPAPHAAWHAGEARAGATAAPAGAAAAPAGEPLQIVQLGASPEGRSSVVTVEENLVRIAGNLEAAGVQDVSIVAIMGKCRTGKSFLMNLVIRYLNWRAAGNADQPPREDWALGSATCTPPPWPGSKPTGGGKASRGPLLFASREGRKTVTLGIWMWSQPVVFQTPGGGRSVVLVMDTQGVDDGHLATGHSAVVFGLTAVLASKLMYNVQGRIDDSDVGRLLFLSNFVGVARAAGDQSVKFGDLAWIVRDYQHFRDASTLQDCEREMADEFATCSDDAGLSEEWQASMRALRESFASTSCYCLPHPGSKVEAQSQSWEGGLGDVGSDFLCLVGRFASRFFGGGFPTERRPWGVGLTPANFAERVRSLLGALRSGESLAVAPGDAVLRLAASSSCEALWQRFAAEARAELAGGAGARCPSELAAVAERLRGLLGQRLDAELERWRPQDVQQQRAAFLGRLQQQLERRALENELQIAAAKEAIQERLARESAGRLEEALPWGRVFRPEALSELGAEAVGEAEERLRVELGRLELPWQEQEERLALLRQSLQGRVEARRQHYEQELAGASSKALLALPIVGVAACLAVAHPLCLLALLGVAVLVAVLAAMGAVGASGPLEPEVQRGLQEAVGLAGRCGRDLQAVCVAVQLLCAGPPKAAQARAQGAGGARLRLPPALSVAVVVLLCLIAGAVRLQLRGAHTGPGTPPPRAPPPRRSAVGPLAQRPSSNTRAGAAPEGGGQHGAAEPAAQEVALRHERDAAIHVSRSPMRRPPPQRPRAGRRYTRPPPPALACRPSGAAWRSACGSCRARKAWRPSPLSWASRVSSVPRSCSASSWSFADPSSAASWWAPQRSSSAGRSTAPAWWTPQGRCWGAALASTNWQLATQPGRP